MSIYKHNPLTMPTTLKTLTKDIGLLTIALTLALMANFAYSAWSNPTQAPTGGNTEAPINVSSVSQVKTGGLSTGALSVVGNQGITGQLQITNSTPRIRFTDSTSGDREFWAYVNASTFYILADRDNADGDWEGPHPLSLVVGAAADGSGDSARFAGQVQAASFLYSSDERLKENIATVTGMDVVQQLRGVEYTWKSTGKKDYGVIAQEVETLLPELIYTNEHGVKSVDYAHMIAFLIEALKEQQVQIDALEAQVYE